jgi:hypothetical protein
VINPAAYNGHKYLSHTPLELTKMNRHHSGGLCWFQKLPAALISHKGVNSLLLLCLQNSCCVHVRLVLF